MKKQFLSAVLATALAAPAMAGGLLTNTNQNAAFLRNFAQEGQIDITALYANPAGTAFLNNGWHLSLNNQTAFQKRLVDTTFPLFALNANTPGVATHNFKGTAAAPVIPSFQLSYNQDKWSVNAAFGLVGGGGKCTFDDGLGSFEALYAGNIASGIIANMAQQMGPSIIPGLMAGGLTQEQATEKVVEQATAAFMAAPQNYLKGYSMDKFMKGTSYNFGLQVGGTYKALDNLSFFAGLRFLYAMANYQGYVRNVNYETAAGPATADGIELDCDQKGFGVTPILGVDWKINDKWNVSAKYEFKTRMRLKNSTSKFDVPAAAASNPTLAQFKDGETVKDDVPGILAIGVQYKPIENLKLNAGYHWFQDTEATKSASKHNYVHDSHEVLAGVEYKFCKWVAVSASWQKTMYDMDDDFMNDVSFNNSSNSIGCGFRIYPHKIVDIDLGYMHTFYEAKTVESMTAAGKKTDVYNRKNDVFGVGVNLHF